MSVSLGPSYERLVGVCIAMVIQTSLRGIGSGAGHIPGTPDHAHATNARHA
jgi:hypothetical protein